MAVLKHNANYLRVLKDNANYLTEPKHNATSQSDKANSCIYRLLEGGESEM